MKCGFWMYTPGERSENFENDIRDGVMALAMGDIPDLSGLSAKQIAARMRKNRGNCGSYEGIGAYTVKFRDMPIGDIVFVKQGYDRLIGVGRVVGEYRPMPERGDGTFIHTRRVDWLNVNVNSRKRFNFAQRAFYSITEEFAKELMAACKISSKEVVNEEFDSRIQAEDIMRPTKCRGGQAQYRAALLKKWNSRCAVTGITELELLRASHVKPFKVCRKDERYDVNNGLILAAHVDALFDSGLITFADDGAIVISSKISKETITQLRLTGLSLSHLNPQLRRYLVWHRKTIYKQGATGSGPVDTAAVTQ